MTNSYPFVVSGDEFKGKRVLVTGGTKGIGAAIVRRFEVAVREATEPEVFNGMLPTMCSLAGYTKIRVCFAPKANRRPSQSSASLKNPRKTQVYEGY